ncbi:uncharacterized protein SCDLUD_004553 [Saccharomycodes ludwigii]|uniref:uncharacterized protein n=1 Tax=Saccharomycodes ludwigii TaxID=36035 RepID=UPI001E88516C|nr:hypothetical protein SCDLUD_004553 [Saccharomycodes ludwigii]KAH3899127.1 hypothetical protein SCDLUD_004553 [Saccharomycodes ludwigii]
MATKFKPFDVVIARYLLKPNEVFHLSKPLMYGAKINTGFGSINHDDIIGKPLRSIVFGDKDKKHKYIVTRARLSEYVINVKREAQPIYPVDASLIVQAADINVSYPTLKSVDDTEIYKEIDIFRRRGYKLAKNKRNDIKNDSSSINKKEEIIQEKLLILHGPINSYNGKTITRCSTPPLQFLECGTGHGSLTLQICKSIHASNCYFDGINDLSRGSIIHSLDRNLKHMKIGIGTVSGFQKGIYLDDVEFHYEPIGPSNWVNSDIANYYRQLCDTTEFLQGCFLDMPSPEHEFTELSKYLTVDGFIIVFTPSISQIWDCYTFVKDNDLKLTLVSTFELLTGGNGGMREWDVRRVMIRNSEMVGKVVKPRIGVRIVGGGFIGIFRKIP